MLHNTKHTISDRAMLTLRCGRRLAWREYGNPSGFPILFMHGNLNSRLFEPAWAKTQSETSAAGARVIASALACLDPKWLTCL